MHCSSRADEHAAASTVAHERRTIFAAAIHYATALLKRPNLSDEERIRQAYEAITSQVPSGDILDQLKSSKQAFQELYMGDPAAASAMLAGSEDAELAAWTMLVHSLFNLDTTKTRE